MFSQDQETLALAKRLIVSPTLCKNSTVHIPDILVRLSHSSQVTAPTRVNW